MRLWLPAAASRPSRFPSARGGLDGRNCNSDSLGNNQGSQMEHMELALKQGMEGVELALYRALSWMSPTHFSSAASSLPLWSSPARLSLPHSVEHLPVFMGQFHLLLIQFSSLFDFNFFLIPAWLGTAAFSSQSSG